MTDQKVYILSRGHYSDYEIIGVETDKARAKRIQKLLTADHYGGEVNIETWTVGNFGEGIDDLPTDRFIFWVYDIQPGSYLFRKSKKIGSLAVEKADSTAREPDDFNTVQHWDRIDDYYSVKVWAKDYEHAAKIGADLIAEYKAREAGITD